MTTSAFKSSSRRDAAAAQPRGPPASRRRSHSVSAVSRKNNLPNEETGSISTEFSNSRDNPLFWTAPVSSSSPPDREAKGKNGEIGFNNSQLNSSARRSTSNSIGSCGYVSEERGRSFSRNGPVKRGIGRSLSRGPKDLAPSSINGINPIGNSVVRSNSVRNTFDAKGRVENARLKKNHNRATEWSEDDSAANDCLQVSNLEDEISTFSLSEAEEKTIDAVCEELNAFLRNDVDTVKAINVADAPPDLVKPGAVELISDIRREYAMKLEQSEERARKLRADLTIEEQHGHELDRVLKEIIPDPKTSNVQRPRRGRRRSNERKKMSNRLTEEAMAYFDECVSLSTFDSSDFSASEDPLFSSSGSTFPVPASSSLKGNPSTMYCYDQDIILHHEKIFDGHVQQSLFSCEDSRMTTNSSSIQSGSTRQFQFSFGNQKPENVGSHEDIISYVKHFERGSVKDSDRSSYDADEYAANGTLENMLIDRVLYNNRIETGGLLLCGGAISSLPFASAV